MTFHQFPADPFTINEPQDQEIGDIYVAKEGRSSQIVKGYVGVYCIPSFITDI